MAAPVYPNVPNAPGVPPLLRRFGTIENTVALLTADAQIVLNMFLPSQWGIFTSSGAPLVIPDTVLEVGFRSEARISDAPQEQGGFVSYNKVQQPFDARVSMAKGGTSLDRNAFLAAIEAAQASLDLFVVVTPDVTYPNVNITHYDYRRTQKNGATLLVVDVWMEEVRQTGTSQFTQTAAPQGANQVNGGTVYPQPPSPAQASSSGLLGGGV